MKTETSAKNPHSSSFKVGEVKLSDGIFNGSSCSAPIFASMIGLLQSATLDKLKRKLTNSELLKLIKDNLIDLEEEGHDNKTGHGLFILPKPWEIDYTKYLDEEVEDMSVIKRLIDEYGEEVVEKTFKRLIDSVNDDGLPTKWAEEELQEAVKLEITDGQRPEMYATRQETAIMVKRALKKSVELCSKTEESKQ